jgi:hypothetical protein
MEKPKITHKMVRRMSFMKFSFLGARGSMMKIKVHQAQGRARQRTTDDNGPSV